jgi:hypothetical protein
VTEAGGGRAVQKPASGKSDEYPVISSELIENTANYKWLPPSLNRQILMARDGSVQHYKTPLESQQREFS